HIREHPPHRMRGVEDPLPSGANDAGHLGEDDLGVLDEGQCAIRGEGDIVAVRGEGQLAGIGEKERRGSGLGAQRVLSLQARGLFEHSGRDTDTGGDGTLLGQPPRALAGTAADLEDLSAGDIAEEVDVGFVNSLWTPDEIRCAEERAVLGQILLGGIVPVTAIGPDRGLFVDRQIIAADDLDSVSSLSHRSSVAAGAQKSNPGRAFTPRLVLALTTVCACAYKSKFAIETGSVNCGTTIGPADRVPDLDQS